MKILVAGGAGFIGSHLTDLLLRKGHDVVCVDNYFIGTKENISHFMDNPRFRVYEQDLCDYEKLSEIFQKEQVAYVFHLAANSDIQASAQNPAVEYHNTYSTTFRLLECMRLHQVKKLFFASTSAVYGEKTDVALKEETPDLRPISYYGAAKLGAEALISAFCHMNDMQALVFRFPNVIGPRLTHGVIYDFIHRLKADSTHLRILGDGTQCKPYIYVDDLTEAIVRFMDVGNTGMEIYNLGVEGATSVKQIADIVCKKMGIYGIPYEYTGGKIGWKGDVPRFCYDLTKIHAAGWKATYTSDQAVEKTVEDVLSEKRRSCVE